MRNDVQVVATVLSVEQDNLPEIVAMVGSSIALSISEIPFDGPIGAVAVGYIDGEYVMNPTVAQREDGALDLVVSGTKEAIMMVEAGADEVSEELMIGAILAGHEEIKKMVAFQEEIIAEIGKEKCEVVYHVPQQDIVDRVMTTGYEKMNAALRNSRQIGT